MFNVKIAMPVGGRFGRLLVLREDPVRTQRRVFWFCKCDCGKLVRVLGKHLRSGHASSCGCLSREALSNRSITHGATRGCKRTREYEIWCNAKKRCHSPKNPAFKWYGARGIKMCPEWKNSFAQFLSDMGPCPPGLTLERKDNYRGYEPDNCKWATRKEQSRNKRKRVILEWNGKSQGIIEWAEELKLSPTALKIRYYSGWTVREMMTLPMNTRRNKTTVEGSK